MNSTNNCFWYNFQLNKLLELTFSDGSRQRISLLEDETEIVLELTNPVTSVRMDILDVYTQSNNGATKITFYGIRPVGNGNIHPIKRL